MIIPIVDVSSNDFKMVVQHVHDSGSGKTRQGVLVETEIERAIIGGGHASSGSSVINGVLPFIEMDVFQKFAVGVDFGNS